MFLLNVGHSWSLTGLTDLTGTVCLPSGMSAARLARGVPDLSVALIDPQLYLAGLDASKCKKVCGRLAGYPWFQVPEVQDFVDSGLTQTLWEKQLREEVEANWPGGPPTGEDEVLQSARDALEFQANCGATSLIIPSPLLDEREDEAETLGIWLDAGLSALEDSEEIEEDLPVLASVAVHVHALNQAAFEDGGLLDAIVDQVAARQLDGVYLVVVDDSSNTHPFDMPTAAANAYMHLTQQFSLAGVQRIVTNFADLVGLVSLGLGATSFASGPFAKQRFMNLNMFKDAGFGVALPHFYSHRSASEYRSERDLHEIVKARLVRQIEDETDASAPLMDALKNGQTGQVVPSWIESKNNTTASSQHYVEVLIREGRSMRLTKARKRRQVVIDWLNDVDAVLTQVDTRAKKAVGRKPSPVDWLDFVEG